MCLCVCGKMHVAPGDAFGVYLCHCCGIYMCAETQFFRGDRKMTEEYIYLSFSVRMTFTIYKSAGKRNARECRKSHEIKAMFNIC